ncbi:hypothetical protein K7X08_018286 [Anisodus acutangulus]|uniref:Uncharacterized protein n=1 Tax=Anisodus acutangulus TaxID=402998 RepID=A0A9Q1M040_9SOLA|nr:hypothetical protein K7X08_018286 [Anisodus acutangulus]
MIYLFFSVVENAQGLPTPGHYLGLQSTRGDGYRGDRGRYRGRDDYGYRRSPRRSPYRGGRDYSPRRSPYAGKVETCTIPVIFSL